MNKASNERIFNAIKKISLDDSVEQITLKDGYLEFNTEYAIVQFPTGIETKPKTISPYKMEKLFETSVKDIFTLFENILKKSEFIVDEEDEIEHEYTIILEGSDVFNLSSNCDQLIIHNDSIEYENGIIRAVETNLNKPLSINTPKHLAAVTNSSSFIEDISFHRENEDVIEYMFNIAHKVGKDEFYTITVKFYNFDIFTKMSTDK